MNYINVKVIGSKLKVGSRISELVGNCTKRQIWFSSFARSCAISCGSNNFEKETSINGGIVSKRNYNIMVRRQKGGNNCTQCDDHQLFTIRRIDLLMFVRCMAGHSKWQNIRHIKAAKDRERSIIIHKYSLAIKKAVIEGGANPKGNTKLAQLLEEAKKNNVPNASIERSIAKAKATPCKSTVVEIQGPGGCILVVEAETDNVDRFTHDLKLICRRVGAMVLPKGRSRAVYDQKGIIIVNATKDNSTLECAKAIDVAIEAGAEDVQETENDNKEKTLQFLCDPDDLFKVKKHIESTNYIVIDASVKYIARDSAKVDLSDEQLDSVENLYNQLEEFSEVTNIYDNIN